MAEPGDTPRPNGDPDHDAEVGFSTPQSLAGRPVDKPESEETPDLFAPPEPRPEPEPAPAPRPEPAKAAYDPFARTAAGAEPQAAARVRTGAAPAASAGAIPSRPLPMGLYSVYVLILLAVPTLGVSGLIALLSVGRRTPPDEPVAASHFVYQQRTLWIAAIAAVLGAVLVVVNIGVFVLFAAAIWILVRGAYGVMKLKDGLAVPRPTAWLF